MDNTGILKALSLLRSRGATDDQLLEYLISNGVDSTTAPDLIAQIGSSNALVPLTATQKASDWFKGHFGKNKSILGDGFALPNIKDTLQNIGQTSLYSGGPSINALASTGAGLYQGANAISNLGNINASKTDLKDLVSDIKSSAFANPMAMSALNSDQKKLFRQLKNGSYKSETSSIALGEGVGSALSSTPKALLTALPMLLMGNPLGAGIQAGGTLLNAGLEGANKSRDRRSSDLQSLYDTLLDAENSYNAMRRPANVRSAGLQNRYLNQLY